MSSVLIRKPLWGTSQVFVGMQQWITAACRLRSDRPSANPHPSGVELGFPTGESDR